MVLSTSYIDTNRAVISPGNFSIRPTTIQKNGKGELWQDTTIQLIDSHLEI